MQITDDKIDINDMKLVQGKYFRVYPICKVCGINPETSDLMLENLPIEDGLAIERRNDDESYYVVCFVKPHVKRAAENLPELKDNTDIELEDVDFRTVDILKSMKIDLIYEYINCVEFARDAIKDILEKGNKQ